MSKLSFISSSDRKYNISRVLSLIKSDITSGLKSAKNVVVKPNFLLSDCQLAATHADAIDAILEFISPYLETQIILAEGGPKGDTLEAFKNYDYFKIQEKYDLALVDLNSDEMVDIELLDAKNIPHIVKFPKTIINADYFISVAPPKTDSRIIYSGAISNIAPSFLYSSKHSMATKIARSFRLRQAIGKKFDYSHLHRNISSIFSMRPISLAVIDGFYTMQGNGPGKEGQSVSTHWAIASTDALSSDLLSCKLLGIDQQTVTYLDILGQNKNLSDDIVVGDDWSSKIFKAKLPDNIE